MRKRRETIEIQKELHREGSKLKKYELLILGRTGLFALLKYELIIGLTSWLPGAVGFLMRGIFYPKLMGSCGRNVQFGMNVVLRHPGKIHIGNNVVVDDKCVVDAKGQDNRGILIGSGVFIGRNTILNCKNGNIILGENVNIGFNSMIFSASEVRVGANELIAAYVYLVGGTHHFDNPNIPVLDQPRESKGITVGPGGWLGAHTTVFDGVHVGKHAVIGANSTVNKNIPDYAIAAGSPVKVVKNRTDKVVETPLKSISIGIVNYNGENVLGKTIRAAINQEYPNITTVYLADNASTDNSIALVREKFSEVEFLHLPDNRGPNPARNAVLQKSDADYVLLIDNDIILNPDVLSKLSAALIEHPDAGIAGAQIRSASDPSIIQYNAANIHYAGGAIANKFPFDDPVCVGVVPAGCMLVHRQRSLEIGLWDEDYFYGWADGDFAFRMTISGFSCLHVAGAKVYHAREKAGLSWTRLQVRNRWWFMLKNYHWRTIFFLLPAILLNQLAMFIFLTLKGRMIDFIRGSSDVWRTLPAVMRKRKAVMRLKKFDDKQTLSGAPMDMLGAVRPSFLLKAAMSLLNGFFSVYWILMKRLIK